MTQLTSTVFRLEPGQDLCEQISSIAETVDAAVVVCAVGSLSECRLRMAGVSEIKSFDGPLEIVSVTGSLGAATHHVHISVSNSSGTVYGGHLVPGCKVYTTVELVLLDLSSDWQFIRKSDATTGYLELCPTRQLKTPLT
jgi:predicted DNA-binding protein with PD1-like motif